MGFMRSISVSLFFVGALLAIASVAQADNINTSGTACRAFSGSQSGSISYTSFGVVNVTASAVPIICPLPRFPLSSGATSGQLYVDGFVFDGGLTSCTVYVTDYTGAFLGSQSFQNGAGGGASMTFDQPVSFSSSVLSTWAYAAVFCNLAANGRGSIFGITSIR
jgi:hypothetical protein